MIFARNGREPRVDLTANVSTSAQVVGDVEIGGRCFIDHNVVIASGGSPIEIGESSIVFAGSVIRSVGGHSRPAFGVRIGPRALVSPLCTLTGCDIGRGCYVATGVIVLQGAVLGDYVRVGVGAIVHAGTKVPPGARIGMRRIAAPSGDEFVTSPDVGEARDAVAAANFFETVFATTHDDQPRLHEEVIAKLHAEVSQWRDDRVR